MNTPKDLWKIIQRSLEIGMLQHTEEVIALAMFVAGIEPRNVMEIGSWKGGLFHVFCNIANNDGLKVSVDTDAYGDLTGTIDERNLMMHGWANNVHTIIGDSHSPSTKANVVNLLQGEKFDFIFIDGDHSYFGVKLDYEMYRDLVRPGGWIAFHDINSTAYSISANCLVSRLWEEIDGHKVTFTMQREWGGIGLVRS